VLPNTQSEGEKRGKMIKKEKKTARRGSPLDIGTTLRGNQAKKGMHTSGGVLRKQKGREDGRPGRYERKVKQEQRETGWWQLVQRQGKRRVRLDSGGRNRRNWGGKKCRTAWTGTTTGDRRRKGTCCERGSAGDAQGSMKGSHITGTKLATEEKKFKEETKKSR